jgi:hypothetical protein
MRENTMPTTTLMIEESTTTKPPKGLTAMVARPEKTPDNPNRAIKAMTSQ